MQKTKNGKKSWKQDFRKNWPVYLMFLPLAIYFIIFNYIPMGGILMAFEKFSPSKGILGSEWVGLKNFVDLFTGQAFTTALRNTVCMAVINLVFGFFPPIILAIVFSECQNRVFRRFAQICSYLPNFVSAVVVCALVTEFLKSTGAVTEFLTWLGFERQNWLANPNIPVFWIINALIGVWVGMGYGSIVYTTAISNVNNDLKEAAALDGANRWQRVRYIVIPSILPLAMMMLTLSVGTVFMVGWDKILILYMPKTYDVADVLYTYTYRMAFGQTVNYGLSTASGLFQSVVGTILLVVSNKLNKKATSYSLF
ncbi:MAG: ABC transporter permease subunit [Eubacteriales bacterium]|nr:ABC transporter permease subunit [Eubacteriales bacterium]